MYAQKALAGQNDRGSLSRNPPMYRRLIITIITVITVVTVIVSMTQHGDNHDHNIVIKHNNGPVESIQNTTDTLSMPISVQKWQTCRFSPSSSCLAVKGLK